MNFFFTLGLISCIGMCLWLGWQVYQLKLAAIEKDKQNLRMQQDLHGLIHCMRGIGERFEQQQKQLRSVSIRQNDLQSTSTNDSHYEQAVLLMDKGASIDELIKNCGLSKGEAELLNRINSMSM